MAIEDYLGGDREERSEGLVIVPHPLSHGPDEVCPGGTDYPDSEIVVLSVETFDDTDYCVKYCRGCAKQWWAEYNADEDGDPVGEVTP